MPSGDRNSMPSFDTAHALYMLRIMYRPIWIMALVFIALIALALEGIVFISGARGQPAPPPPPPPVYKLELDQTELGHLSAALQELPKKIADPLIAKLHGQIAAQMQERAAAQKAAEPKTEKP